MLADSSYSNYFFQVKGFLYFLYLLELLLVQLNSLFLSLAVVEESSVRRPLLPSVVVLNFVKGIILELIPSHGLRLISDVVAEEGDVFPSQDVGD